MTNKVIRALSKGIYLFSSTKEEPKETLFDKIKRLLFKKPVVKPKATIIDVIINAVISQHKAEAMRFKPIIIKQWINKISNK